MLEIIATLPRDAPTAGMNAIRERHVTVLAGGLEGTVPRLQRMYRAAGIRTICFVPIVFRDEPLGLLVLYHRTDYDWTADETDLARAFADHMATAIGNARLADSTRTLAERLRAISELAGRLNRLQDVDGIAHAIVAEAGGSSTTTRSGSTGSTTRPGCASRSPSRARSSGRSDPDPETLRVAIGEGLTGWVAAHGETVRLGRRRGRPARRIVVGSTEGPSRCCSSR